MENGEIKFLGEQGVDNIEVAQNSQISGKECEEEKSAKGVHETSPLYVEGTMAALSFPLPPPVINYQSTQIQDKDSNIKHINPSVAAEANMHNSMQAPIDVDALSPSRAHVEAAAAAAASMSELRNDTENAFQRIGSSRTEVQEQRPETPISTATRLPRQERIRQHNSEVYNGDNDTATPQSQLRRQIPDPSFNELAASKQVQRPKLSLRERRALPSDSFPDYSAPLSKFARNSYASKEDSLQERPGQTPGSGAMKLGAFTPKNSLSQQIGTTNHRPRNSSQNVSSTTSTRAAKPFDLSNQLSNQERPAKRQKVHENPLYRSGATAASPVEFDIESITAKSDLSISESSRNSKRNRSHLTDNLVSGSQEFKRVESQANPKGKSRKSPASLEPQYPSKKQCLDEGIPSSKNKISRRLKNKDESSKSKPADGELDDDRIEDSPHEPYRGNARPSHPQAKNGMHGGVRSEQKSRYFNGQASRPKQPPMLSLHPNGKEMAVDDIDDVDELSQGHQDVPVPPRKREAAKEAGPTLVQNILHPFARKKDDIPNTEFKPSKSSNTRTSNDFALASFIAGALAWKVDGEDACRFVFRQNGVLEPYRDDRSMTVEAPELMVFIKDVTKIVYGEYSKKLFIYRRIASPQKSRMIFIELGPNGDPGYFVRSIHSYNDDIDVLSETGEHLDKMFRKMVEEFKKQQARKAIRPKSPEAEDLMLLQHRSGQRQRARQQAGNNTSSSITTSAKTAVQASASGTTDRPRRRTRASNQETNPMRDLTDEEFEKVVKASPPPPPPVWTKRNKNWQKHWGDAKSQLDYPLGGKNRATVDLQDIERLNEGEFLNDNLISFYIRYLQEKLQGELPENFPKVYFHNSFFYHNLTKERSAKSGINYDAVKRWTSKVDLFEKEFIIVPINEDTHWYLAIVYNAPALKIPKAELAPNEKSIAPVTDERQDGTAVQDSKIPSRQSSQQPQASREANGSDLPKGIENMTIECHGETREPEEVHDNNAKVHAASEGFAETNEVIAEVPDSQPGTPQRITSSRPSSPALNGRSQPPTPESPTHAKGSRESESKPSKLSGAHIFILDSLGIGHPSTVRNLKEYLSCEASAKLGMSIDKSLIRGHNVKGRIPQQENYCDCGVFLLGYIEKFLMDPYTFSHSILNSTMTVKADWGHMLAPRMRAGIRELVFKCKSDQDDMKKASPKKKSKTSTKDQSSLEPGSRENSEPSKNSARPSPDSPSEQLRQESRPTSAGSQTTKAPVIRDNGRLTGTERDAKVVGGVSSQEVEKGSAVEKNVDVNIKASNRANELPSEPQIPRSRVKLQTTKTPSSTANKSSPLQLAPSRSSRPSSVDLEPAHLLPDALSEDSNFKSSSRKGSPNNPVELDEDISPSSSHTLVNRQTRETTTMGVESARPVAKVQDVIPVESQSQEDHMLLDDEDGEDGFLSNPVAPTAVTSIPDRAEVENTQAPRSLKQSLRTNGGESHLKKTAADPHVVIEVTEDKDDRRPSAPKSSVRASATTRHNIPNSTPKQAPQKTYTAKGGSSHGKPTPEVQEVIDLD